MWVVSYHLHLAASTNQILPEMTAHYGMQRGSSTKTWKLNGMTLMHYCHTGTLNRKFKVLLCLDPICYWIPIAVFFSSLLPLAHSVDTWLPSIISQWDFPIQISVWQIQKSTIKNREIIAINFNKFIKIWGVCICSNQHWEMVPLKINMKNSQYSSWSWFIFNSH